MQASDQSSNSSPIRWHAEDCPARRLQSPDIKVHGAWDGDARAASESGMSIARRCDLPVNASRRDAIRLIDSRLPSGACFMIISPEACRNTPMRLLKPIAQNPLAKGMFAMSRFDGKVANQHRRPRAASARRSDTVCGRGGIPCDRRSSISMAPIRRRRKSRANMVEAFAVAMNVVDEGRRQ